MSTTTSRPKVIDQLRPNNASKAPAAAAPTPAPEGPATVPQLREAFGEDPEFMADAIENRLTLTAAWQSYTAKLRQIRDDLRARAALAQARAAYPAAVDRVMKERGVSRPEATTIVNREQPELRAAYVGMTAAPSPVPLTLYEREVQRVKRDRKCSMAEAVNIVNSTRPDLRAAYLNR